MPSITAVDAARKFEVSYRQVYHWLTKGYVKPEGNWPPGTGNPVWIGWREAEVLECLAALVNAGIRADKAAVMARGDRTAIRALEKALDLARGNAVRLGFSVSGG